MVFFGLRRVARYPSPASGTKVASLQSAVAVRQKTTQTQQIRLSSSAASKSPQRNPIIKESARQQELLMLRAIDDCVDKFHRSTLLKVG